MGNDIVGPRKMLKRKYPDRFTDEQQDKLKVVEEELMLLVRHQGEVRLQLETHPDMTEEMWEEVAMHFHRTQRCTVLLLRRSISFLQKA
jgi:hypothetical protein